MTWIVQLAFKKMGHGQKDEKHALNVVQSGLITSEYGNKLLDAFFWVNYFNDQGWAKDPYHIVTIDLVMSKITSIHIVSTYENR